MDNDEVNLDLNTARMVHTLVSIHIMSILDTTCDADTKEFAFNMWWANTLACVHWMGHEMLHRCVYPEIRHWVESTHDDG